MVHGTFSIYFYLLHVQTKTFFVTVNVDRINVKLRDCVKIYYFLGIIVAVIRGCICVKKIPIFVFLELEVKVNEDQLNQNSMRLILCSSSHAYAFRRPKSNFSIMDEIKKVQYKQEEECFKGYQIGVVFCYCAREVTEQRFI